VTNLSIALLQLARGGTTWRLLRPGEAACRQARVMGADIALFPELWTTSYTFERPGAGGDRWRDPALWRPGDGLATADEAAAIERWQALAIRCDSAFVDHFRQLARDLDLAIALTFLEAWAGPPRNTVSLIDRHGELVLTYAKVHTCDFDLPEAALTPGDDFPFASLTRSLAR
jgi:predicted amidohydrolase